MAANIPGKPIILTFTAGYMPGHKFGGPVMSVTGIVDALRDEFNYYIVTSDRDLGNHEAYTNIKINTWDDVNGTKVLYLSPGLVRSIYILYLIVKRRYDVIYVNSFFAKEFSILVLWAVYIINKINNIYNILLANSTKAPNFKRAIKVLIAPRGEFGSGALGIKKWRKKIYLTFTKYVSIYANVYWHASSEIERKDIERVFRSNTKLYIARPISKHAILVASDLAKNIINGRDNTQSTIEKVPGILKVVFISRICRMKNLDMALKVLSDLRGQISIDIYGPIEDLKYWEECLFLAKNLSANIQFLYRGVLEHEKISQMFREHHLLLLPTRGENFGHVIIEALSSGCPVLISDQTPWRKLQNSNVGWDISLDNEFAFREVLKQCVSMDNEFFKKMSDNAINYANSCVSDPKNRKDNIEMFRTLLKYV